MVLCVGGAALTRNITAAFVRPLAVYAMLAAVLYYES